LESTFLDTLSPLEISSTIDLSRNQARSLNYQDKILNVVDV